MARGRVKAERLGRRIAGLAAVLATAWLVAGGARAEALRIGTDGAYPPFNATTASGQLVGFEIDLARDLCRRMQASCSFVSTEWSAMIPNLRQGRVDIVMSAMSASPERRKVIDFSRSYFSAPNTFLARADSDLARIGDLGRIDLNRPTPDDRRRLQAFDARMRKAVVGVEGSTAHEKFLRAHVPNVGRIRVYPNQENLLLDMVIGRVDAIVMGGAGLKKFIEEERAKGRRFTTFGPGVTGGMYQGVAFGIRQGEPALKGRLDAAILAAQRDGTVRRLSIKWFGFDGSIRELRAAAAK